MTVVGPSKPSLGMGSRPTLVSWYTPGMGLRRGDTTSTGRATNLFYIFKNQLKFSYSFKFYLDAIERNVKKVSFMASPSN